MHASSPPRARARRSTGLSISPALRHSSGGRTSDTTAALPRSRLAYTLRSPLTMMNNSEGGPLKAQLCIVHCSRVTPEGHCRRAYPVIPPAPRGTVHSMCLQGHLYVVDDSEESSADSTVALAVSDGNAVALQEYFAKSVIRWLSS